MFSTWKQKTLFRGLRPVQWGNRRLPGYSQRLTGGVVTEGVRRDGK